MRSERQWNQWYVQSRTIVQYFPNMNMKPTKRANKCIDVK